jgi:ABC-type branched-subunit amino acid transport system permease subunit/ABC-type branched-subunit amino acid transport system ATPase component
MNYVVHLMNIVSVYAILTMSLNLLLGYTGLISLAHGAFFGLGAYSFALVMMHTSMGFLAAMVVTILITTLVATLIAIPALRTRADYLVLLTLGFQVIIFSLMGTQRGLTRGLAGLGGIPRPVIFGFELRTPLQYLPLILGAAVACFLLLSYLTSSPFGRLMRSMREDEDLVRSYGKDVTRLKVTIFMLAGAFAAIGGGLFATYTTFLTPLYFRTETSIVLIAMVALGGMGNLWGSVVGAFTLIVIPEALTFLAQGGYELVGPVQGIVWGALLILAMRFRPQGFVPERWTLRRPRLKYDTTAPSSGQLEDGGLQPAAPTSEAEVILAAEGLTKAFGGLKAVRQLHVGLLEGQITALIGSNGAGKTTVFNLITGFEKPDEGRVVYRDTDLTAVSPHRIVRHGVVRSWQGARVFGGLTVLENVLVARPSRARETLWRILATPLAVSREEASHYPIAMQCLEFVGLNHSAGVLARELSFADQKMLQVACLLATEADVLLLDEPMSGVDPYWIARTSALLRELVSKGRTLCIIEHNLDVVRELADVAFFLDTGRVIRVGTPEELMQDDSLIELYFGT